MSSIPALARVLGRVRLLFDNLMRPLALPFAGGLASALFMFVMLLPDLGVLRDPPDTPTALYTEASVGNLANFGSKTSDDTVVEVQVDEQGRMVDYNVLEGKMTGDFGNLLLFATFTPATVFLQPTSNLSASFISRASISAPIEKFWSSTESWDLSAEWGLPMTGKETAGPMDCGATLITRCKDLWSHNYNRLSWIIGWKPGPNCYTAISIFPNKNVPESRCARCSRARLVKAPIAGV